MSNTLSQIGTKVGTEFKAHRLRIEALEGANAVITDTLDSKIASTEKGAANGVATLDATGKVPSNQLPSYVDDVVEATNLASFPATGETGKIYVALDTNKAYRWSGSAYIYITSGAVDSVAGKTGVVTLVKGDVGLGNVDNTADADKPISTATQSALNAKQATITGAATTITSSNLTASMVLVSDASGKVAAHGTVSSTELDYLDGVTSAVQTQLNGKADSNHTHAISDVTGLQTALDTKLASASYTASDVLTKIKTVDGSGSGLDADLLDGQHGSWYAPKDSPEFTGTPTTTTPTAGDSSTRIASTAYVNAEIANDAVTKTSDIGAAALPVGTVAQRPIGIDGLIRYNSDFNQFEGFKSGSWDSLTPTYGFKNHIINGNFDIWQRGTSQTTSDYGSDDRWISYHSGSTKTHSRVSCTDTERVLFNASAFSRTVISSVVGADNFVIKTQFIEDVTRLAGKTVTLSFWAKADSNKNIAVEFIQQFGTGGSPSAAVNGIGSRLVSLTTTWQKKTVTVTLPSIVGKTLGTDGVHTSSTGVLFWFDAGSNHNARSANLGQQSGTFDIAQVQLEEGSVATPFEQRFYGLELSLCQRYYFRHNKNVEVAGLTSPGGAVFVRANLWFSTSMRTAPSITYSYLDVVNMPTDIGCLLSTTGVVFRASTNMANLAAALGIYSNIAVSAEL